MFLLLLIISAVVLIIFSLLCSKLNEDFAMAVIIIAVIVFIISLFGVIFNGARVVKSKYIDEKIAVYEEQNAEIEEEINLIVENYMKFEAEAYGQFKSDNKNGMALIQLYPELKSDALIQQQIQIHTENNATIKNLKEKRINYKVNKWWLNFGG